jgi:hypothetical protein
MKSNIDLTMNQDFRKETVRSLRSFDPNSDITVLIEVDNDERFLKSLELNTDFPIGRSSDFKRRRYMINLLRQGEQAVPSCERCSRYLYIKDKTLCIKCDKELDEEMVHRELMSRFR